MLFLYNPVPLRKPFLLLALALSAAILHAETSPADPATSRQLQYLEDLRKMNNSGRERYPVTTLHDRTWEDWQNRTGELPPDFASMPSSPFLPDPLVMRDSNGTTTPIRTPEHWAKKRDSIKQQFTYWISGSVPPPPGNVEATILHEHEEYRSRVQMIELRFGPDQQATMTLELITPAGPGPFPVFMTQWNHRNWAQLAVSRGYIACIYAGADVKDDTEAYAALYPDYEFSRLMRRAWGASRVVDYLHTLPEVNKEQIAITGHSRNGKQSLWATAFDERISAVITSSCGTGGITPWRFSDPQYVAETIDWITSIANTWFHPRLRFFFGHEDRLPIDQNEFLSLIAPRPLLMHYSVMEQQINPWAAEQCFQSVKTVYDFLKAPEKIGVYARDGEHAVAARDVEFCIDFLDIHFRRNNLPWNNRLLFSYDFNEWLIAHADLQTSAVALPVVKLQQKYDSPAAFEAQKPQILNTLNWLLGEPPPSVKPDEVGPTEASRIDWKDEITGRPTLKNADVMHIGPYTAMGNHMPGTLYYPKAKKGSTTATVVRKYPLVIYLHDYAYAHGFARGYSRDSSRGSGPLFQKFVDAGFAVLAIDQFGFGTRAEEAINFYQRQPQWSKLGKMVADVSDCIDAMEHIDIVDSNNIFVLGHTIGGTVGITAAALDSRIAATAVVDAFSPWRSSNSQYESIRVLSHLHGLLPRLGLFAEQPATTPLDYQEILATIAPRPLMVIAPSLSRHNNPDAVSAAMESVASIYQLFGASDKLHYQSPREINRINNAMVKDIIKFYNGVLKRR